MAAVKKLQKASINTDGVTTGTSRTRQPNIPSVSLPVEYNEPSTDLSDYSILLYGEKKIGKSSLCAQFPDSVFLMTDPMSKSLHIRQCPVQSWQEFLQLKELLKEDVSHNKENPMYKWVVIDVIDLLYDYCLDYVCVKEAIPYPAADDYGKSWKAVRKEFEYHMLDLLHIGKGIVAISHAKLIEIEKRDGEKFHQIKPSLSGQPMSVLEGRFDLIFYYGYVGDERVLTISGNDFIDAGSRAGVLNRFVTPEGESVLSVPMGNSEEKAYKNLMRAWNNKQKEPGFVSEVKQPKSRRRS